MKRSIRSYGRGRQLKQKFYGNKRILFLMAMFAAGLVAGAEIIKNENTELTDYIISVFKSFMLQRSKQSLGSILFHSALSVGIYIATAYLLGLCVAGVPIIGVIPFIKGLGPGVIMGYLYSAYKWKGMGYSLLIIFPGTLLSAFALILACGESLIMSIGLFSLIQGGKPTVLRSYFKTYNVRYLVFFLISMTSALFECILIKTFGSLFSF